LNAEPRNQFLSVRATEYLNLSAFSDVHAFIILWSHGFRYLNLPPAGTFTCTVYLVFAGLLQILTYTVFHKKEPILNSSYFHNRHKFKLHKQMYGVPFFMKHSEVGYWLTMAWYGHDPESVLLGGVYSNSVVTATDTNNVTFSALHVIVVYQWFYFTRIVTVHGIIYTKYVWLLSCNDTAIFLSLPILS